jgi:hypothetical protein
MAQAVSRWPLTAEARVRVLVSPCGICDGQSGTGIGFYPSSSVVPCKGTTDAHDAHAQDAHVPKKQCPGVALRVLEMLSSRFCVSNELMIKPIRLK